MEGRLRTAGAFGTFVVVFVLGLNGSTMHQEVARRCRIVAWLVVGLLSAPLLAGCLGDGPDAGPPGDPARFDGPDRPDFTEGRAVVAVIDTGANPYHEDFLRPERDWRARGDLPGYPERSHVLPLTLDAADQDSAIDADRALWDLTEPERLYDVPGTAFVGLIAFGAPVGSPETPLSAPGFDEAGHGTAAAGMVAASCPQCLLVAVEVGGATEGRQALKWAERQTWIDIIVYPARAGVGFVGAGTHAADADSPYAWARPNAEAGQVVVVAAGNGPMDATGTGEVAYLPTRDLSYSYWTAGPDWVLTVGTAGSRTGSASTWHTYPVDVLGQGLDCDAPHPFSVKERVVFEGTSCSAPVVGGQIGSVLAATREAQLDGATGPRSGQRLVVPERIDQVETTREDLVRAYLLTAGALSAETPPFALPDPTDPKGWSQGESPASPLYAGWGVHDPTTLERTVAVLTGAEAPPEPTAEEAHWFPVDQRVRLGLWGGWDRGETRIAFPEPFGGQVRVPEDEAGLEALYLASRAP